jgi:acetylornithine deacetylase/succinyl-diaminopimelate desuccinylase-like protein
MPLSLPIWGGPCDVPAPMIWSRFRSGEADMKPVLTLVLAASLATASPLAQAAERPDQTAFKGLYKELVEINTTLSVGSCTTAAQAMGKRLVAAGYPAAQVRVLIPQGHPKFGALAATLHGSDPKAKAVLLLAHIDVVEAKRADWTRDPFKLVEEGGYFYGRGTLDDKSMAAVFVDNMVRYKKEGFKPRRDIKLALTCGEETSDTFDGVDYLLKHNKDVLDAAFALNEGGQGRLDEAGKRVSNGIQVGEKIYQDFALTTTNPGGHSSRPVKDNAIYDLAGGLVRLGQFEFPVDMNPVTRAYFAGNAPLTPGPVGEAMARLGKDGPTDLAAAAVVAKASPSWNSMLRTTCVATLLNGGHAPNALPQSATANVNCRILPGHTIPETQAVLAKVLANPAIKISLVAQPSPVSAAPPLSPEVIGPAEAVGRKLWGADMKLIPMMSTGATDGRYLNALGIPTYGLSGTFVDPDGGSIHGLNERVRVQSLYEGRDFLYEVVKLYGAAG